MNPTRHQTLLKTLKQKNNYRTLNKAAGLDLTSNDYLGMRDHPALRQAALEAIENGIDLGSGGSRLLRGHTRHHESLEHYAAKHFKFEKTLYFATGFQANLALLQALPSRHDTIIFDEHVHASTREGIRCSPAHSIKIVHNDLNAFESALKQASQDRRTDSLVWIAVESLYSMDGDFAPLQELKALANTYEAILIIDEAHSTGIYESPATPAPNIITLHTCGKALGVAGGLICASDNIINTLINTARGFIYSTAPPPLQALLTQKSLEILASPDGDQRRVKLVQNRETIKQYIPTTESQIIPIILGDNESALNAANHLQSNGYDIRAIRPPTVPKGTARLRLSLSSTLETETLERFGQILKTTLNS